LTGELANLEGSKAWLTISKSVVWLLEKNQADIFLKYWDGDILDQSRFHSLTRKTHVLDHRVH
jgi:hypothetical protein